MSSIKTCFFLLSFSAGFGMFAQTISGKVTDQNGQPLPGCNVYLVGTFTGTSTQGDGSFSFEAEAADSALFKVEFIGYEDFVQKITLRGDIEIDVELKEAFNKLNAVTVSAGAYGTGDHDKTAVLNSLDVATTAGALADVTGAMQTLPGTSTNGESGRLFVHGGSATETGTYIDGILVHQPYTSSTPNMAVRGRFNPFMFSGTSFSTGGYSAEYGQALSSVLLLNTNEIPEEEALNLGIMTIGLDAAGTTKWNKGALTVGANYMNLAPYMALIPQNYDWDKAPESFGAQLSFRQQTKNDGLLKVYANIDESNLMQKQYLLGNPEQQQTIGLTNKNRFANVNYKVRPHKKWMLKTGASFTHNTDDYELATTGITDLLQGAHAKAFALNQINKKVHLKVGTEYFYSSFRKSFRLNGVGDSSVQYTDHKPTAFAEAEVFANNDFGFKVGVRGEYSSYLDKVNVSPRISAAYKLSKTSQVSLAYGWFYQDPIQQYILNRPYLTYEKAEHYIASYTHTMGKRNLRAEAYYKGYKNLVKFADANALHTNDGTGYAYGFDFYFRDRKTIKNGDYWISYSFLNTERNYLDYPVSATPSFASAHNISVVYKHWFSKLRSQLGATFTYGSPRTHNNPNNEVFMDERLKAFKSLDMNWSYLFRENVIFHLAFSNVLGIENSFGYNYNPVPDANGIHQRTEILPAAKHFVFIGCFITLSAKGTQNQLDKIN